MTGARESLADRLCIRGEPECKVDVSLLAAASTCEAWSQDTMSFGVSHWSPSLKAIQAFSVVGLTIHVD